MKFMGDYPMKGQAEQDVVSTILRVYNSLNSPTSLVIIKY